MIDPPVSMPVQPLGMKGCQYVRLDKAGGRKDEREDGDDLDEDEDVVGAGRLANAAHQDDGEHHHDEERRDVEAEVPAGLVEVVCRRGPAGRWADRQARST